MSTSAVPAVLTYLVSTFTAATTLGANPTSPVSVIFGETMQSDFPPRALWVGCDDPDANPFYTGAASTQRWTGPGARRRDENLSIRCVAQSWTGGGTVADRITDAYAIVSAVEDLVRVDANLGGNVLYVDPGVTNLDLRHGAAAEGYMARVLFTIDAFARIGA